MKELVKIVNHGKNGVYMYSGIIRVDGVLFWTTGVYCKAISDKYKIDWLSQPISRELNEWSLNTYNLK